MPKREAPIQQLNDFLPPGTYKVVSEYLYFYKIHLTITRPRKSILGDYRHQTFSSNHRISINGNLNPFAFLITLLHEISHMLAFEEYGKKIVAHGKEWKSVYSKLLEQFLEQNIFPTEIESALKKSLKNPAASSCAEDELMRVLRKYDKEKNGTKLVEEIPVDTLFRLSDGRVFKMGDKQRKRYKCLEVSTQKLYLFSPVYEVEIVSS
jgi:hypothetical protein